MDFFPSVFSQNDLLWLDNLMPANNKKEKKKNKKQKKNIENGTAEVLLPVFDNRT